MEEGVKRAVEALAPDVVRIRFKFDEDSTGEPSIYFKVVMSADAWKEGQLADMSHRVTLKVREEVDALEMGLNTYFRFRTMREPKSVEGPDWA